jgi:hypothetical protein
MESNDDEGPVTEITLERYRLKELPADVMAALDRRMQRDAPLRLRAEALAVSDDRIRASDHLQLVAARVRARAGAGRIDAKRRGWTSVARWALPAAVAAGVALMFVLPGTMFTSAGDGERIKGLDPSLTLFRQVGAGSETLADGAVAHQGDVIRVGYRAAGRAYGVILSLDGRQSITMHLPTSGDDAVLLGREPTVLLDRAYELDDAPRWERFYFITADAPFPVARVVASIQRAIAHADGNTIPALALDAGLDQSVFTLQKESPQ